jgi:hypothetical protein
MSDELIAMVVIDEQGKRFTLWQAWCQCGMTYNELLRWRARATRILNDREYDKQTWQSVAFTEFSTSMILASERTGLF